MLHAFSDAAFNSFVIHNGTGPEIPVLNDFVIHKESCSISEIMLLAIFQEKFGIMVFVRVGTRCMALPVARGPKKATRQHDSPLIILS